MKPTDRQRARPTLLGLAVDNDSPTATTRERVLYPWRCVGRIAHKSGISVWTVYGDDGRDRTEEGRFVQLALAGRPSQLAAAAQSRRFRQDWYNGRLDLSERYDASRRAARQFVGLLVFCGILFAAVVAVPGAQAWQSGSLSQVEGEYGLLLLAVCLMWALVSATPVTIALWLIAIGAVRPNVLKARFDNEDIRARLLDGTETTASWSDLTAIRCERSWAVVQFTTCPPLRFWLGRNPRTRVALTIIRDHFHPEAAAQQRQSQQRALARCGAYWVVASVLTGLFLWRFRRPDQDPYAWITVPGVMLLGVPAAMAAISTWRHLDRTADRRRRRRKR